MFVHWGLYSQLGVGEWTFWTHKRDINEYKLLKDTFTAEYFDAEKLVLTAKNAGKNFILKGDDAWYMFFFDLSIQGDAHVTVGMTPDGKYAFYGVEDEIMSIEDGQRQAS